MYAIRAEGLTKRYGGTTALDGMDLEVPKGKVVGLLGPQGSGKTTAVRILATLLRPDAGRAEVGGHDVVHAPDQVRALIGLAETGTADLLATLRRPVLLLDEPTAGLTPHARDELWAGVAESVAEGATVLLATRYLEEAGRLADHVAVLDRGRVTAEGRPGELRRRVGGQILHVRPTLRTDLDAVAAIMAALTGGTPARDEAAGLLSAPADDPLLVSALVRRLEQAGIPADELGLRLPTPDEVFQALTRG